MLDEHNRWRMQKKDFDSYAFEGVYAAVGSHA